MNFMMKHIKLWSWVLFLSLFTGTACTDLKDETFTEASGDDFAANPNSPNYLLADIYLKMEMLAQDTYYAQEFSGDAMCILARALTGEWGGDWTYTYLHKWNAGRGIFVNAWAHNYEVISSSNLALKIMEDLDQTPAIVNGIAEIRVIRAFAYFNLLDMFGRVPVVTEYGQKVVEVPQSTPAQLYAFIESEIEKAMPNLLEKTAASHFNKYSAQTLLAKLYLNAEKYTGTAQWAKCQSMCDLVLENGGYALENDWNGPFKASNSGSSEIIFALSMDEVNSRGVGYNGGFVLARMALHSSLSVVYNSTGAIWNGIVGLPSFVKSFAADDARVNGWNVGMQFNPKTGEPLRCTRGQSVYSAGNVDDLGGKVVVDGVEYPVEASKKHYLYFSADWYDLDLVSPAKTSPFPKDVTLNHKETREYTGARFVKYEIQQGVNTVRMNNDYVVFRLADVKMMKAECIMRQNGGAANGEAVALVNEISNRACATKDKYNVGNLTLDALCQERGWEFYGEGQRRTDLIRFGKFAEFAWESDFTDVSNNPIKTDIMNYYPIPKKEMDKNVTLTQNAGY